MSRRMIAVLCLLPIIVGGLVFLWRFNPAALDFFPRCPFYALTGYKCPGCGTLRAIHFFLNGRFADAIAMNPILVVFTPLLVVFMAKPKVAQNRYVGYAVLVIVVAYWIVRNLV